MKLNISKVLKKEGCLVYSFVGKSMLPLLKEHHNKVLLKTSDTYNLFDIVLFKRKKNVYVLHRIISIKDDTYILIGDNSSRLDYLRKEDILAKVTGVYEQNKLINIDDIDNNNPYKNKNNRERLIKNPTDFFLSRKKEAYYELIKLATLEHYDETKIKILTQRELIDLCMFLDKKKGLHLLGFAIDNKGLNIDSDISKYAVSDYHTVVSRITKLDYSINEISKAFCKNKIKHIFLKGSEIRSRYKMPFLRNSYDIDIYINKDDLPIARETLINYLSCDVYIEDRESKHDESYIYKVTGIKIELHYCISVNLPPDLRYLLDNPLKNAIQDNNYKYRYHLNAENEGLYYIVHTAKHMRIAQFWYSTIIDYYYLKNNIEDKIMNRARLNVFRQYLDNYINYIYHSTKLSKQSKWLEEFVFSNTSKLSKIIGIRKSSKFKYILKRLFVPYSELKRKYTILNKHPLLFPILSIYRWICLPFKISSEGKLELQALKKANDKTLNRFKLIGLSEYLVNQEENI